ncbi:MAG: PTS sugar transporter subunit IIC [Bacilli bacterium]
MANNTFLNKLDSILSPIGNRIGNQRHLKAVSTGMMVLLPLIVIGAFFLIIANPPINPELGSADSANFFTSFLLNWKTWATENYTLITTPFNMTMGLFGLMSSFAIAFALAEEYKMKSVISGFISMALFFMVAAPQIDGGIATTFMGADGLFVAIIVALVSVEITHQIEKRNWVFKFPDSVPTAVTSFVNSLLPVFANIVIIYGLNIVLVTTIQKTLPESIMSLLTPAFGVVDNIWGFLLILTFSNILWIFGVNGTSIVFPILFTLGIQNTGINAELVAAGQEPTNLMNLQMFRYAILGGAGNTLGLIILMWRSRSTHLRTLSRVAAVPGICGINEPIIFGAPVIFNPILGIPFILTPIVTVTLGYWVQKLGFVTPGHIIDPSFTPFFAGAYLSALDVMNVVFVLATVPISMCIYYPFFKIFEKNILEQEQ